MSHARRHHYAVGYFESWDLPSLQGVVDAAEQSHAPIIIGFNGEFMANADRLSAERIEWYGALGRAAAESAKVPCGFIFNECSNDRWVKRAAQVGFNLVMLVDPDAPYADYVQRVCEVVAVARTYNAAVEGEIGELPFGAGGQINTGGHLTDPDQAARFVEATGVDLLAVSVGNVHILIKGQQELDLAHLGTIQARLDVPLVLHGGTGIAADSLKQAIKLGVTKVNYGTYLKQRYLATLRKALQSQDMNPHHLLGVGGNQDVMVACRHAMRDAVRERIGLLNCCGKA